MIDEIVRVVIDEATLAELLAGAIVSCRGIAADRPVDIELEAAPGWHQARKDYLRAALRLVEP
jgi:hypothetical protein